MATAQAIWFEIPGLTLDLCVAMVEQLTKLTSCVAYTRRSCHKLGLNVASKLTPVLVDLKAEVARLATPPAVKVDSGTQTEHGGMTPIGFDADCQTENEMISRVQCEAIMHNVGSKYMSALEQANAKMKEQMDTIASLQEQLAQQVVCLDVGESPTDDDDGASVQRGSMVCEQTASSSDQVLSCPADLTRFKEDHLQQRLALKRKRREHRLALLSQHTPVNT